MTADQEPTVFEVVDWQGVFVRCSRRDWDRVIQKHPDMRERLRDVIKAVRAPDLVARDRDISVHVVFYRRSQDAS